MAEPAFDAGALRERHRAECDKRLRTDANDQYVEMSGQFARYLEDPSTAPVERAPLTRAVEVVVIGGGFGGLLGSALVLTHCTPKSAGNEHGDVAADLGTITLRESGGTTVLGVSNSSPGQGACRTGSVEVDVTGSTVTGGSSAYAPDGEAVSAQLCVTPTGKVKLLEGTVFAF